MSSEILLRPSVTLYVHFLQCHKMYLRLLGCLSYKVTPRTVSVEYTLRNYLWYDSSSCPVGWVGNFHNGCKWVVSIRAVVALLERALSGISSPCRPFRRHFCQRRDRETQSLCFDTRGWQPFVVIPPHSACLYLCYLSSKCWQEPSSSLCVLPPLPFSHLFMSFRLCMFLVPIYLVMFDKITSV